MSDDDFTLHTTRRARLTADVTFLMLKGAGYAMIAVLAIWFTVWVTAAIGRALPERSREAPDPTPTSFLMAPETPSVRTV